MTASQKPTFASDAPNQDTALRIAKRYQHPQNATDAHSSAISRPLAYEQKKA
jgi:hypothetical protein